MSAAHKSLSKAAAWILFSPVLFLMAAISTVESETTYYVQLVIFGFATLVGVATGIAYIFGWAWGAVTGKYMLWTMAFVFVGIPILIGLTLLFKIVTG